MLKAVEPISNRVCYIPEGGGAPEDICTEGYRLENGLEVQYLGGKWIDSNEHEYTAVSVPSTDVYARKQVIGFVKRDTLDAVDKEMLSSSPEGEAYVRYNELIGGERVGLSVSTGYPSEVQEYLDEGGSLAELYEECIAAGITWYERFSLYPVTPSEHEGLDVEYERIYW